MDFWKNASTAKNGSMIPDLNGMPELNIGLLLFSSVVTLFLLIGVFAGKGKSRSFMKSFQLVLVSNIVMQFGQAGIYIWEGKTGNMVLLKLCSFLSFGAGAMVIAFYCYCLIGFVREKRETSYLPAHIIAGCCCVIVLLAFLSITNGMFFRTDANDMYIDGPYVFISNIFDPIALFYEIFLVFYYRECLEWKGIVTLACGSVLSLFTMFLQEVWYPTPEYLVTTLSMVLVFLLFHGEITKQLIEKEEKLAQRDLELADSRIKVMVSQIQPHFLYNSLNSIYHLIEQNPDEARKVVSDFSDYLRMNIHTLECRSCVPFETELKHVKTYLKLEVMRFGDKLNVIYDIKTVDFVIPPLSVQPIVENAVKHGVFPKREGGTVTIRTVENEDAYLVVVQDDGVGFVTTEEKKDGKTHIGIRNTQKRLREMCGASLEIESELGKGTCVRMRVLKASAK